MTLPNLYDAAWVTSPILGVKNPRLDSFKISKSQVANIAVTPMPQPGFRMTPFSMGPFCWKNTAKRVLNHLFFEVSLAELKQAMQELTLWQRLESSGLGGWTIAVASMMKGLEEVVHFGQSISIKVQRCLKGTSPSLHVKSAH